MTNTSTAFIWDFDGVVVFTPHYEAWSIACQDYGIKGFTREFYDKYVSGRPRVEGGLMIFKLLAPGMLKDKVLDDFLEYKNKVFHRLVREGKYKVNYDVVSFIQKARSKGILQVLASASRNAMWIAENTFIDNARLIDLFDLNVSAIGLSKEKIFAKALEKIREALGRIDNNCIVVFEDAIAGIIAAKNLGLKTVGYNLANYTSNNNPDLVVKSLKDMDPLTLLSLLGCKT